MYVFVSVCARVRASACVTVHSLLEMINDGRGKRRHSSTIYVMDTPVDVENSGVCECRCPGYPSPPAGK